MSVHERVAFGYTVPEEALRHINLTGVERAPGFSKSRTKLFGEEDRAKIPFLFPEYVRPAVERVDLTTHMAVLKEVPLSYTIPRLIDEFNRDYQDRFGEKADIKRILKESNQHFTGYAGLCRYPVPADSRRLSGVEAFFIDDLRFGNDPDRIAGYLAQRGERVMREKPKSAQNS